MISQEQQEQERQQLAYWLAFSAGFRLQPLHGQLLDAIVQHGLTIHSLLSPDLRDGVVNALRTQLALTEFQAQKLQRGLEAGRPRAGGAEWSSDAELAKQTFASILAGCGVNYTKQDEVAQALLDAGIEHADDLRLADEWNMLSKIINGLNLTVIGGRVLKALQQSGAARSYSPISDALSATTDGISMQPTADLSLWSEHIHLDDTKLSAEISNVPDTGHPTSTLDSSPLGSGVETPPDFNRQVPAVEPPPHRLTDSGRAKEIADKLDSRMHNVLALFLEDQIRCTDGAKVDVQQFCYDTLVASGFQPNMGVLRECIDVYGNLIPGLQAPQTSLLGDPVVLYWLLRYLQHFLKLDDATMQRLKDYRELRNLWEHDRDVSLPELKAGLIDTRTCADAILDALQKHSSAVKGQVSVIRRLLWEQIDEFVARPGADVADFDQLMEATELLKPAVRVLVLTDVATEQHGDLENLLHSLEWNLILNFHHSESLFESVRKSLGRAMLDRPVHMLSVWSNALTDDDRVCIRQFQDNDLTIWCDMQRSNIPNTAEGYARDVQDLRSSAFRELLKSVKLLAQTRTLAVVIPFRTAYEPLLAYVSYCVSEMLLETLSGSNRPYQQMFVRTITCAEDQDAAQVAQSHIVRPIYERTQPYRKNVTVRKPDVLPLRTLADGLRRLAEASGRRPRQNGDTKLIIRTHNGGEDVSHFRNDLQKYAAIIEQARFSGDWVEYVEECIEFMHGASIDDNLLEVPYDSSTAAMSDLHIPKRDKFEDLVRMIERRCEKVRGQEHGVPTALIHLLTPRHDHGSSHLLPNGSTTLLKQALYHIRRTYGYLCLYTSKEVQATALLDSIVRMVRNPRLANIPVVLGLDGTSEAVLDILLEQVNSPQRFPLVLVFVPEADRKHCRLTCPGDITVVEMPSTLSAHENAAVDKFVRRAIVQYNSDHQTNYSYDDPEDDELPYDQSRSTTHRVLASYGVRLYRREKMDLLYNRLGQVVRAAGSTNDSLQILLATGCLALLHGFMNHALLEQFLIKAYLYFQNLTECTSDSLRQLKDSTENVQLSPEAVAAAIQQSPIAELLCRKGKPRIQELRPADLQIGKVVRVALQHGFVANASITDVLQTYSSPRYKVEFNTPRGVERIIVAQTALQPAGGIFDMGTKVRFWTQGLARALVDPQERNDHIIQQIPGMKLSVLIQALLYLTRALVQDWEAARTGKDAPEIVVAVNRLLYENRKGVFTPAVESILDWPTPTDETRAAAIELFEVADEVLGNVHSAMHLGRLKYTLASKLEKENRMAEITRLYEEAESHLVNARGRLRRMASENKQHLEAIVLFIQAQAKKKRAQTLLFNAYNEVHAHLAAQLQTQLPDSAVLGHGTPDQQRERCTQCLLHSSKYGTTSPEDEPLYTLLHGLLRVEDIRALRPQVEELLRSAWEMYALSEQGIDLKLRPYTNRIQAILTYCEYLMLYIAPCVPPRDHHSDQVQLPMEWIVCLPHCRPTSVQVGQDTRTALLQQEIVGFESGDSASANDDPRMLITYKKTIRTLSEQRMELHRLFDETDRLMQKNNTLAWQTHEISDEDEKNNLQESDELRGDIVVLEQLRNWCTKLFGDELSTLSLILQQNLKPQTGRYGLQWQIRVDSDALALAAYCLAHHIRRTRYRFFMRADDSYATSTTEEAGVDEWSRRLNELRDVLQCDSYNPDPSDVELHALEAVVDAIEGTLDTPALLTSVRSPGTLLVQYVLLIRCLSRAFNLDVGVERYQKFKQILNKHANTRKRSDADGRTGELRRQCQYFLCCYTFAEYAEAWVALRKDATPSVQFLKECQALRETLVSQLNELKEDPDHRRSITARSHDFLAYRPANPFLAVTPIELAHLPAEDRHTFSSAALSGSCQDHDGSPHVVFDKTILLDADSRQLPWQLSENELVCFRVEFRLKGPLAVVLPPGAGASEPEASQDIPPQPFSHTVVKEA